MALGWKLYKDAIYTRYLALKNTGHPQYFGGALCSIAVFVLSFSIDRLLLQFDVYRALAVHAFSGIPVFSDPKQIDATYDFARIFFWALPSTYVFVRLLNLPFHKSPSLILAAARKTRIVDELEETIYYCLRSRPQLSIAITTKSKKVYIGVPKRHSPDPDRDRVWLALWPLASGYRDEKGELTLTTFYGDVAVGTIQQRLSNYQVVIPLAEVAVAQAFDLLAYAKYQQRKRELQRLSSMPGSGLIGKVGGRLSASGSPETSTPSQPVRDTLDHHAQLMSLADTIVSHRDRYILRMYGYYVFLLVAAVLSAPHSLLISASCFALAAISCYESIEPILVRIENWWHRRRESIGDAASDQ